MGKVGKTSAIFLTLIVAMSCLTLLIVKPAKAQTSTPSPLPTPSVPQFTATTNASSIEVTIKNQGEPLTAMVSNTSLYYGFRFKDHENIQDWNYAPLYYVLPSTYGTYYKASDSDYTAESFQLGSYPLTGILGSGEVDVQVMALVGNEVLTNYENGTVYAFYGVESGWSPTQTITLSSGSPSPTVPEFSWLVIMPLMISLFAVAAVLRHRKTTNLIQ